MWNDRPTEIRKLSSEIEYILCIDENGTSNNLSYILKHIANGNEISEDDKFFTVTGCIFSKNSYKKAQLMIKNLKRKYWENGLYFDNKQNIKKMVCFHSRDIRKHDNCFNESLINYDKFIVDLTDVMKKIDCKIISISINLYEYLKLGYTHNVYNVAFDFLLERYIYSTKGNKKGIVILEARGKGQDKDLLKHVSKVILKTGTKNISSKELSRKIKGVFFNPKWGNEYNLTYTGLEITDLYSYPIHKYIKRDKKDKAFISYEDKICGYPDYMNKGIKIFPNKKIRTEQAVLTVRDTTNPK